MKNKLNEELLFSNSSYSIFKNPQSIKRMSPWKIAISDINGNLFVLDDPEFEMIHEDLAKELKELKELKGSPYYLNLLDNYVLWSQSGKTNSFYLSETYYFPEQFETKIKRKNDVRKYKKIINEHYNVLQKKQKNYSFFKKGIWDEFMYVLNFNSAPIKRKNNKIEI
jgi:hypothetical protein